MNRRLPLLALASAALTLPGLAACGSSEPVAPTPTDTPITSTAGTTTPVASTKVSANDASTDELVAALTAAGVPNAERWAREIEEYRPYPDDPTWAQLRTELAKYNPSDDVLTAILSVLE